MGSAEVREKHLRFFEKRGHKRVPPSPLVLENDPTTLFTSSGMQQLVPFLKGEPHPQGRRLVDSQPCLRLQDIEEVGDSSHTTYFEMLGNWSLGGYFKKDQLGWVLEFFTKELGLSKDKLWVSVFEGLPAQAGTKEVPRDEESYNRWLELGVPKEHVRFYGVDKNWWSRSGTPKEMPAGEIGGPDSEIFFDFGEDLGTHTDRVRPCHPNCRCGRFLEIGNSVFIQYEKQADGSLQELPQKNVDFGGGLERITAVVNNNPDVYKTDIFTTAIAALEEQYSVRYGTDGETDKSIRIIADHLRAAAAIIANGIAPDNKGHGYILRRLIRRSVRHARKLDEKKTLPALNFPGTESKEAAEVITAEAEKFSKALGRGLQEIEKIAELDAKTAFYLYESYGFPLELTEEIAADRGQKIDKAIFEKEFEKHKNLSRTASAGMFKGGLAGTGENVTKLHTATHLLHAALRRILGGHVQQKGSNITAKRLRFDFSNTEALSESELLKVEKLVNEQIEKDLSVTRETKSLDEAVKEGALHFFAEKYGEKVKVYTIGPSAGLESPFSREVCGGPHVGRTGEIGRVRIIKQEKIGAGAVRIYATNKVQS